MKRIPLTLALSLSVFGAALATPQGVQTKPQTRGVEGPKAVKRMTDKEQVEAFFENLPKMRMDKPIDKAVPKPVGDPLAKSKDYITNKYTLASTPEKIVTMGEISALWLGAIVPERWVRKGGNDVTELPFPGTMRAPLELTFSSLGGGSKLVKNPTKGSVKDAVNALLTGAIQQRKKWGDPNTFSEAYSFDKVENQNETQTALKLGLNVRYLSAELKSGLSMEKKSGQSTVTAAFVERAFTISAKPGTQDQYKLADRWVTPACTMDVLKSFSKDGLIGPTNLPCYVSGITYGRRLIFNMTSKFSASQLKFALEAAYKGASGGGEIDLEAQKILKDSETTIKVAGQGGPSPDKIKDLLLKGDLGAYFSTAPTPGQLVPISYEVRSLVDDAPVVVLQSDEYIETQYIGNAKGRRYQVTAYAKLTSKPEVGNGKGEIYGEFRIDDKKVWAWDKSFSGSGVQSKKEGDTIEILSATATDTLGEPGSKAGWTAPAYPIYAFEGKSPKPVFKAFIRDDDGRASKDDYMGSFNFTLDIRGLFSDGKPLPGKPLAAFPEAQNWKYSTNSEGQKTFTAEIPYSGSKQNGSSRLYLKIEEVGTL